MLRHCYDRKGSLDLRDISVYIDPDCLSNSSKMKEGHDKLHFIPFYLSLLVVLKGDRSPVSTSTV